MNNDYVQLIIVLIIAGLGFKGAYHVGKVFAILHTEKKMVRIRAEELKKKKERYNRLMWDIWADNCTFEFNAKNPDFSELESILNNLHIPKESEL